MPRPKPAGQADIENNFAYHPATEVTGPQHDEVRAAAKALALKWNKALPAGRHKAMAISFLQQAMWAANAAIAADTVEGGSEPAEEPVAAKPPAKKVAAKAPARKVAAKGAVSAKPVATDDEGDEGDDADEPAAPTPIKSAPSRRVPRAQRAARA